MMLSAFGEADQPEVSAGHLQAGSSYKRWESLERLSPELARRPAVKQHSDGKNTHTINSQKHITKILDKISMPNFQTISFSQLSQLICT